jgi:adenosine deaminase
VNDAFVRSLPKAEVHVHLEGCFEREEVERLAREAGETAPLIDNATSDLTHFLMVLDATCRLVRTPDQVARAAYAFAQREATNGVGYADVIVNPTHWPAWRDRLNAFVDALHAGFCDAEADHLPPVGVCVSLLRQQTAPEAIELVEWILKRRHPRLVALSIDGNEAAAGRTGPRFADAFHKAAEAGMHRTVHAGESSGPEGVRDALEYLCAERIDHGIRAIEDADLVRELAERQIPLNVCPGSNVMLGLYPDRNRHPLDALRRAGVRVSINTDDPALMRHSLVEEYVATARTYAWDERILQDVARASIEASFAPDELKRSLLDKPLPTGSGLIQGEAAGPS